MIVPRHVDTGNTHPEEEGQLLAGLPDTPDAGMYVVDDRGRITEVNRRAEALLGRSAAELLGQDAHDLMHRNSHGEPLPRAHCHMMRAFLGSRTGHSERGWFERGDGSLLETTWMVTPCPTGDGRTGALVLFHERAPTPSDDAEAEDDASLSELDRLALLAETTTILTSTLDVAEALRRLLRLVAPRLGDWVVVDLITEEDEVWRSAVVHAENGTLVHRADLEGPMPPLAEESPMPLSRALRGAASTVAGPRDYYDREPDSGTAVAQRELFQATGMHSAAIVPIRGLREVLGALTVGRADRRGPFGAADLSLVEDIARRAGLALDNARLYERQRRVAETMQRHLLPQLPRVRGLEMTARYVPAPHASQVGGDWYDAFLLSDGATALVIGDVVGHDLDAAAAMAQIRNILRAYAWDRQGPPSLIVERLDQAAGHIAEASVATMVLARVEAAENGGWALRWTNAGHPPPLLVRHDGQTSFLEDGHGLLLGTGITPARTDAVVPLPPLSTLVLYTDGLIESPGRSLDEGLDRLRRYAAALAHRPLGVFCDQLLDRVRPADNEDDVAMLALRVPGPRDPGEPAPASPDPGLHRGPRA